MLEPRDRIETAILRARAELEDALIDLKGLPFMDQTALSFGVHALTNLLTLATASVDIVQNLVKPGPDDARLAEYLLVLEHSIDMMVFTVTRLTGMSGLQ